MKSVVLFFLVGILIFSCSDAPKFHSENPNVDYFYKLDSVPKVYLYRDVAKGLEEEFSRIYTVTDNEGEHVVVERYASDGRLLEATNFNIDSLNIQDHMVVNFKKEKEKSVLYKNTLFPMNLKKETWFAVKFKGVTDSTVMLKEVKRKFKRNKEIDVMGEKVDALVFEEKVKLTVLNPFTKKEESRQAAATSYFAKGFGLVEWHSANKKVHYRLERILEQQDWVKIITR
jgi:hypothetical protein